VTPVTSLIDDFQVEAKRMTDLSRRVVAVLSGLTAATVLAACGGSGLDKGGSSGSGGSGGGSAAVDIGLLLPQSGVYAPIGKDMEQGFKLCLDQKGGSLGGHKINIKQVDEGGGPDTGVPAAQKLVQSNVKAVVGVVNSATVLGVKDLFTESKIPLIVANAGADSITGKAASEYVWRTSFANGEISAAMGKYLAGRVKGGVYLLAADYAGGKEHLGAFRPAFEAAGGKIVGEAYTPFGTTQNFQPFLERAKQSGAKAIYVFYAGSEAVTFVKQYAELGLKGTIPLFAPGFLTEGGVLAAQGNTAVGVETALHYSTALDTPANKKFVTDYTAVAQKPPTVYSVQAYDACQVLDKALAKGTDGPRIIEGLKSIDKVDSPRGEFKFSAGHGPDQTYYLRKVAEVNGVLTNTVVQKLNK